MNTRLFPIVLILAATSAYADTDIYRCPLDDGTIAFQEMPCAEPDPTTDDGEDAMDRGRDTPASDSGDDAFDFVNPFDEPAAASVPVETALPEELSEDRAACEKTTRDAIDAIDLELSKNTGSKEQNREYLAELLELTRQLRACKRL